MNAPLTDAELRTLRARLEDRRVVVQAAVDDASRSSTEQRIGHHYKGEVHDRGEESAVDSAAEVNSAVHDNHENELRMVRRALERMDEGSYGECLDCGANIGFERLNANPQAARCLRCQERRERDQRG